MSICPKCNEQNEDNNKFCYKCGSPLEQNNSAENNFQTMNSFSEVQQPKPKKKTGLIVALSALVVCLVAAIFVFGKGFLLGNKKPVNRLQTGITNVVKADSMDSSTKITLDVTSIPGDNSQATLIKTMIKQISINSRTKFNKATKESYYDVSLDYAGQSLVEGKIYVDEKGIVASIPALYSKNIYIDYADIKKLQQSSLDGVSSEAGNIDFTKYMTLFTSSKSSNVKKVSKDYETFFNDKLKDNFKTGTNADLTVLKANGEKDTIKCSQITFTIDSNQAAKVFVDLLAKAASDSNLKGAIKDKAQEFLDLVEKNNDYDKFGFTKDEAKEAMSTFDSEYDDAMKEIKNADLKIDDLENELGGVLNFKTVFSFDKKDALRGMKTEIGMKSTKGDTAGLDAKIIIDNTVNSLNEKVTIEKISRDGAVNLGQMDEMQAAEMEQEMGQNAQSLIGGMGLN